MTPSRFISLTASTGVPAMKRRTSPSSVAKAGVCLMVPPFRSLVRSISGRASPQMSLASAREKNALSRAAAALSSVRVW